MFSRIAGQSLSHLNILPKGSVAELAEVTSDREPLPEPAPLQAETESVDGLIMPDFHGKSYRQVLQLMQRQHLNLKLSGSGQAVEQYPRPGKQIRYGKQAWVRFGA